MGAGSARAEGPQAARRARIAAAVLVALSCVTFVAIRVPYLSVPLERDEGGYAYIAQRIGKGEVPYRDAFDQKPPGIYAVYGIAVALFGRSVEGIHFVAGVWTAGTALVLGLLVGRLAGGLAAGFAVLGFGLISTDPRLFATAANTELFLLLPSVASAAAVWRARGDDRARVWWASGAWLGVAVLFKQVALTQLALIVGMALVQRVERGASGRARRIGAALAGLALPLAGVGAGFAALGAWEPFIEAVWWHNLDYAGVSPLELGLVRLGLALGKQLPSLGAIWLLAALALVLARVTPRAGVLFLGFWLLSALAGVSSGLYFRPHYFVQALPPLAALAGVSLAAAARPLLAGSRRMAVAGVAILSLLVVAPPVVANVRYWGAGSRVAFSRALYAYNPFPEAEEIARFIRNTSGPDDTLFVLGSEPELMFLAERRSATRYIYVYPLTGDFPDAIERQREAMQEVRRERPLFVVWVEMDSSLQRTSRTPRLLFDETRELIRTGYTLELVAIPAAPDGPFEIVRGNAAGPRFRELRDEEPNSAWVAVFRRAS